MRLSNSFWSYTIFEHQKTNLTLKEKPSINFVEVMIHENISWKDHIKTVENKICWNIGLLYRGKQVIDEAL